MSYVENISQAATASSASSNTFSTQAEKDAALGKEDFLTLLVAQLQNQDPLNPNEPTEFTAQLAQFSSLEQLFNLNESMDSMAASFANSDKMGALETIGKDIAYQASSFEYNGQPVEIGYSLDSTATDVTLYLQQNGSTIKILEPEDLTAGNHFITWDGTTESGGVAPYGEYSIVIQAKAGTDSTVAAAPLIKAEVTGVDLSGDGGGTLQTTAGEIGYNAIIGVYDRNANNQTAADGSSTEEEESEETDTTVEDVVADAASDAASEAAEEAVNSVL